MFGKTRRVLTLSSLQCCPDTVAVSERSAVIKTTGGFPPVTPVDKSIPLERWNGGFPRRTADSSTHLVTPSRKLTEINVNEKKRNIVSA
jgi:hypothetical protein